MVPSQDQAQLIDPSCHFRSGQCALQIGAQEAQENSAAGGGIEQQQVGSEVRAGSLADQVLVQHQVHVRVLPQKVRDATLQKQVDVGDEHRQFQTLEQIAGPKEADGLEMSDGALALALGRRVKAKGGDGGGVEMITSEDDVLIVQPHRTGDRGKPAGAPITWHTTKNGTSQYLSTDSMCQRAYCCT